MHASNPTPYLFDSTGKSDIDLTQTSYSTIPSVDVELGNQASAHDKATLATLAEGLLDGIEAFFASGKPAAPGRAAQP